MLIFQLSHTSCRFVDASIVLLLILNASALALALVLEVESDFGVGLDVLDSNILEAQLV